MLELRPEGQWVNSTKQGGRRNRRKVLREKTEGRFEEKKSATQEQRARDRGGEKGAR